MNTRAAASTKGKAAECGNFGNRFKLPFRGGSFYYVADSGVFAVNLNWTRALSSYDVGFRAALPHVRFLGLTGAGAVRRLKESVSMP